MAPTKEGDGIRLSRVMVAYSGFCVVEYAYWAGVLIYAYTVGGAAIAGVVLLAQLLPAALLAAPLGSLVDRLPTGAALVVSYATQSVLMALLAVAAWVGAGLVVIVTLSALVTIAVALSRPLHYAALPQLVPTPRLLVRTNATSGFVEGVGVVLGPAIAGLLMLVSGLAAAALASAAVTAVAAVLCLRLGIPHARVAEGLPNEGVLTGVRAVAHDRSLLSLLVLVFASFVVTGSLEILGVSFATDVLGAGASTAGLMMGAAGIGLLIGSAGAVGLSMRPRLTGPVTLTLAIAGLPLLLMAAVGTLPLAVVLLTLSGVGIAMSAVAGRTLLQRTTEGTMLARVFAVQESVLLFGLSLGAILGPLFVTSMGAAHAYVPLGTALIVISLLAIPSLRVLDGRAAFRPDVARLLSTVPFLGGMPAPAFESLAQSARWVYVTQGQVLVRQGHVDDVLYVVDVGRLSVEVDGLRVRVLESGDAFEESALLRASPRTATLTATESGRVLAVSRADFLRSTAMGMSARSLAGLLSEDANEAHVVAALIRAPADEATLRQLLAMEPRALSDVLATLLDSGVIRLEGGVYRAVFGRRRTMGPSLAGRLNAAEGLGESGGV